MNKLYELKGTNGTITAYEDKAVINRGSLSGFMAQGGFVGDKIYYYSDIASIEFKKANFMSNGYIKFILKGTTTKQAKVGLLGTSMGTYQDENTVTFRAIQKDIPGKSEELYHILRDRLEKSKFANTTPTVFVNQNSKMDELKKLAELKNEGVLTEEEFQNEKKKLLDS